MNYKNFLLWCYELDEMLKSEHKDIAKIKPIKAFRRRFRNYVLNSCQTDFVELDGQKMHLLPSEYLKLVIQDHRGMLVKYMKSHVKNGNIVLDVGANIGFYSCLLSKLVGKNGHVFAFEPSPENFKLLKQNVEENKCTNVTIEQKAVSNKSGKSFLNLSPDSSTGHSLFESFDNGKTIEIDTIAFDDYFDEGTTINFIKSDAQGADYPMLLGMQNILKRSQKLSMWLEFTPFLIEQQGSHPKEFLDFLINHGFKIQVAKLQLDKFRNVKQNEILSYAYKHKGCSLLCTKN